MINAKTFAKYAASPAAFRADLILDVDGTARRFGDVMDPWQRDDFAALDPALMRCNGRSNADAKQRCWLERGRGHSKTTDLAVMAVWRWPSPPARCADSATRPTRIKRGFSMTLWQPCSG